MISSLSFVPAELEGTPKNGKNDDAGKVQVKLPWGWGIDSNQFRGSKLIRIVRKDKPESSYEPKGTDESGT